MASLTSHKIFRDADAPWWELRVSTNSSDCYRQHTHDEYSLGIVDTGSSTFRHPEGTARLTAGTVVMIEPHVPHSCNPQPAERWTYRMLFIQAAWLHNMMARHWQAEGPACALEFLARRVDLAKVTMAVDRLLTVSPAMSTHLSEELPRFLSNWTRPATAGARLPVPLELAPAEELLSAAPQTALNVRGLAEACGMHPNKFIREFKRHHGMTPGDYLQDKRVNGARRLIGMGAALSEAALEMGFADQAHLQRAFKARHAMTPGRYRSEPANRNAAGLLALGDLFQQ